VRDLITCINFGFVFSGMPDSLGNNGDQYFNATFGGESAVPEFNPFSVR
jgi:hypothetical protein